MRNSITTLPILAILLGSVFTAKAQAPDWTVNPTQYEHSMFVTGIVYGLDEQLSVSEDTKVAAFINGQVNGYANLSYESSIEQYVAYLLVYSNDPVAQVSFQIYDAASGKVVLADSLVDFQINAVLGDLNEPFLFIPVGLRDIVLSLDEVDGTTKVYPNPASDFLQIESQEAITGYQVFDAVGRNLASGLGETVDLRAFEPGRYLLVIESRHKKMRTSFIKR